MRPSNLPAGALPFLCFGLACCVGVLLAAFVAPVPLLEGWLAAALFWSGLPIGAIVLLMIMRLVPGIWRDELMIFAEAATLLMPLAAALFFPVLLGMGFLYPPPSGNVFRHVYGEPLFFALRTIAWFTLLLVLARLVTRRTVPIAAVTAGLIAIVLLGIPIGVDWVLSRDPAFHSSGFSLYMLAVQACIAMAWLVGAAALADQPLAKPQILAGLLATVLLVWCYFAFLPYFIDWSGNLPASVAWYQRRGGGVWGVAEILMGATALGPLLALVVFPVGRSRRWLGGVCAVVLAGRAVEVAWLILPDGSASGVLPMIGFLVAFAGMTSLATLLFLSILHAQRQAMPAETQP